MGAFQRNKMVYEKWTLRTTKAWNGEYNYRIEKRDGGLTNGSYKSGVLIVLLGRFDVSVSSIKGKGGYEFCPVT